MSAVVAQLVMHGMRYTEVVGSIFPPVASCFFTYYKVPLSHNHYASMEKLQITSLCLPSLSVAFIRLCLMKTCPLIHSSCSHASQMELLQTHIHTRSSIHTQIPYTSDHAYTMHSAIEASQEEQHGHNILR